LDNRICHNALFNLQNCIIVNIAGTVHLTGYQIEDEPDFAEGFDEDGESEGEEGTVTMILHELTFKTMNCM